MANVSSTNFKKKRFFSKERKEMAEDRRKASRSEMRKIARQVALSAITRSDEKKYFDTTSQYQQVDRGGLFSAICAPAQGAAQSQRIGDQIQLEKLELRVDAYYSPAVVNTDTGHKLRVFVFYWDDDDAVTGAPSLATLFQYPGGVGDYRVSCSPYNWQGIKQDLFQVVFDKTYQINHAKDLALRVTIPLKKKVQFGPTLTTGKAKPFLLLVGDDATGAHTPDVQVQWTTRVIYVDA